MEKNQVNLVGLKLNFNNDKNKSKNQISINKNSQNKDKKPLSKNDIDKKKNFQDIIKNPKYDPDRLMEKNQKKLNIINNVKEKSRTSEQKKDIQAQKENQNDFFINSINEIRLPFLFYDISYDILQNW